MKSNIKKAVVEPTHREGLTKMSDFIDVLPKYQATCYERIGEIISATVGLERIMDSFIGEHFCSDKSKKTELVNLLLSTERITYESKRQVLKWIVETHYPNLKELHPTIFNDMQEIGELRNTLAHGYLNIHNFVEHTHKEILSVKKYKNEGLYINLERKALKEYWEMIINYSNVLLHWKTMVWVH